MQLSERVQRIDVSSVAAVSAAAEKIIAQGIDVVDFGAGQPDFPTPEHIKRAAIKALEENKTKYTAVPGIMPLREAVCAWHAAQLVSNYLTNECIVSSGGKHVLFNAICSIINPGDEVILALPYWVSYPDMIHYAGGKVVLAPTDASDGFCIRAAVVEKLITPRTKIIIVNSPSNPTGGVIPQDEFARLLDVCNRHDIRLLTDECYSHFVYGGLKPFSVSSLPGAKEHVVVAGSLSKTFAMTGWRMGYALAPAPLVSAMTKLQSQSISNPTSISQYAALEALRGPMDSVGVMLAEYEKRRTRMLEGLRALPGVTCATPEGAFYAFPDVREYLKHSGQGANGHFDTAALATQLLEKANVAVVPGEAFGAPGYIRLSYATSLQRIDEGLRRLSQFFSRAASVS